MSTLKNNAIMEMWNEYNMCQDPAQGIIMSDVSIDHAEVEGEDLIVTFLAGNEYAEENFSLKLFQLEQIDNNETTAEKLAEYFLDAKWNKINWNPIN